MRHHTLGSAVWRVGQETSQFLQGVLEAIVKMCPLPCMGSTARGEPLRERMLSPWRTARRDGVAAPMLLLVPLPMGVCAPVVPWIGWKKGGSG